jgi:hypothetical protein
MAQRFTEAGIPSLAVSGETSADDRRAALAALRAREVNVLFAVDLFNEGLDIPDVDTLLLLRPTQSATVFLQQLGRGLRRTHDKPVLTVLDLIGQQRREFRFDLKYRALTGASRTGLERQLVQGFAYLPSGCELVLDAVAQRTVLENIRRQLKLSRKELVVEVRSHGDLDLASWLRRAAASSPTSCAGVARGLRYDGLRDCRHSSPDRTRTACCDGSLPLSTWTMRNGRRRTTRSCVSAWTTALLSEREQRYARMLFFSLWPNGGGFTDYQAGLDVLDAHPAVRDELRQVIALGLAGAAHVPRPLEAGMQQVTLQTHARYSREEVLAALDWASLSRKPSSFVAGVVWSEAVATDAFFVTLQKTEQGFSPTTMYRDYALSPELFHWESQNATSVDSPVGRRYLTHRKAARMCCCWRARRRSTTGVGRSPSSASGRRSTSSTRAIVLSPSPGGCGMRCPRMSTVRLADRVAVTIECTR